MTSNDSGRGLCITQCKMKNSALLAVILGLLCLAASPKVLAAGQVATTQSPILKAIQHSGYTTPENAYENYCEISSSGEVTGYFHSVWTGTGFSQVTPFNSQLTATTLATLKANIAVAKTGNVSNGQTICDAGTTDIAAREEADVQDFVVVQALDCDQIHLNQNQAAQYLRQFVASQCKIKY